MSDRGMSDAEIRASSTHAPTAANTPANQEVALVEGSGPHFSAETDDLLRSRLRLAAALLAATLGAFLIRKLLLDHQPLLLLHAVLVALSTAAAGLLWSRVALGSMSLRVIELVVFFSTAIYLGALQYTTVMLAVEANNEVWAAVVTNNAVLSIFALLLLYGMFIPNRWPRALAVLTPIALSVPFVALLLTAGSRSVANLRPEFAPTGLLSSSLLFLAVGVVGSLFGAHTIDSLRRTEFRSRRFGQYTLERVIGEGGMGVVYEARHRLLKRPCAIKVITPVHVANEKAMGRFEREVQATARLSHWNTVEIFDYGRSTDGAFYYVMEYLNGWSMAELVREHGPQPPARVIYLMRQACAALREAHDRGFIHRDIKPGNLQVTRRGGIPDVVKVLDFGLVAESDPESELTNVGDMVGTPLYMPPEQALPGKSVDGRTDIYALGCVMYYLLTGQPPFRGDTMIKIVLAHVKEPPAPLKSIRSDIPDDLEAVVLACLEKDPAARYADVRKLSRALEACEESTGQWNEELAEAWWQAATKHKAESSPKKS